MVHHVPYVVLQSAESGEWWRWTFACLSRFDDGRTIFADEKGAADRHTLDAGTQKGPICRSVDLLILELENSPKSADRQQTDRQIGL